MLTKIWFQGTLSKFCNISITLRHKIDFFFGTPGTTPNYTEYILILTSAVSGCISVSFFASLLGIPIEITSSAIRLKTCVTTAGTKMYMSMIKKRKKKHNKIVLLAKSKLNSIEVLISKALIDSNIIHDEFVLMNNVLKEHDDLKEKVENLKIYTVYRKF